MKHDAWDPDGPSEDEVRALLRSLRVEQSLPDDVATRLDARLAELQASPAPLTAVDELGARRRTARRPARVLLASAAAVAAAVGIGGIGLSVTGGGGVAGGEAASSSRIERPAAAVSPGPAGSGDVDLPELTRAGFAEQADRLGAAGLPMASALPEAAGSLESGAAASSRAATAATPCDAGVSPSGRQTSFVGVLDGDRVLVLVGPRSAAAYACLGSATDGTGSLLDADIRPLIRRPLP